MKIPLIELSTQGLVRLIADASKELQARLSAPIDVCMGDFRKRYRIVKAGGK